MNTFYEEDSVNTFEEKSREKVGDMIVILQNQFAEAFYSQKVKLSISCDAVSFVNQGCYIGLSLTTATAESFHNFFTRVENELAELDQAERERKFRLLEEIDRFLEYLKNN